ncbi:MAG: hypothetical protein KDI14_16905 [Halioglobus sp.]|nr:hypothetical protein [Halioglobus sp.]
MKFIKRLCIGIVTLLVLGVIATGLWMAIPFPMQQDAIAQALASDNRVQVTRGEYLVFSPAGFAPKRGIIFYPGGKTDPATFAPIFRQLAEAGILVVAVPMPINTAFLGVDSATGVMQAFPATTQWYLAGHSLGGVAAAMYARDNAAALKGLILWASYPPTDLSSQSLEVLSIYARNDLSTTVADIEQHKAQLPEGTIYTLIEGNHWQFGHFSDELNQQEQSVSRQQQQAAIVAATLQFTGT